MNLAFDSRPAGDTSGIGRYTRCLLAALRGSCTGEVVETHKPRPAGADIYHSPWLEGALLHPPLPMVVTLHDTIPLRHRSEMLRNGMRQKFRYLALTRAERVIAPTHAIADQIIANLDVAADHIEVIAEAVDPVFSPRSRDEADAVLKRHKLPGEYLLWVGDMTGAVRHRAVSQLIAAKRELPLVLVGPGGKFVKCDEGVFVTGEISDDELAGLYSAAQALVCPTDDDGFGLPILEALACGAPVVAYDTPAMREVTDGRAELFAVDEIEALLRAAHEAARPTADVIASAGVWTWDDVAKATCSVYEDVCSGSAAAQTLLAGSSSRRRHRTAAGSGSGSEVEAEGGAVVGDGAAVEVDGAPVSGRRSRTRV